MLFLGCSSAFTKGLASCDSQELRPRQANVDDAQTITADDAGFYLH
jgi:hypothetical protein